MPDRPKNSRTKLLDASLNVIRSKGYTAATVEDICEAAGVTKGSFFHHFDSKEDLAVQAAARWSEVTGALFAAAPYQDVADPRERALAYLDFRAAILVGALPEFTCLLGTMVQEVYETHPVIREACRRGIAAHAQTVAETLAEAKALYAPQADWRPESLALYTQAALQGAFILAKAEGSADIAGECIQHLRRYLEHLLPHAASIPTPKERRP